MQSMYDILVGLVGQPSNDYESFVLYMTASCVTLMIIYFIPALFKLTANSFSVFGRK